MNPIAGIGGSVGLNGTDGDQILDEALRRGGRPVAAQRATRALNTLKHFLPELRVITCAGKMGEDVATAAALPFELLNIPLGERTSAEDTRAAAKALEAKVNLILFAGGDGTAHDISDAVNTRIVVLGIPCGVKNYSGVFGASPEATGRVAASYLHGEIGVIDCEVLDFDEESMRRGHIETRICGILRVPSSRRFMQNAKSPIFATDEDSEQEAIAKYVVEEMDDRIQYILGPGSTTKKISDRLGVEKTLLGVDLISGKKLVVRDLIGPDLEKIVAQGRPTKLIVSPIGGQGFILGRGNQQLTPSVIRKVGKENIIVVCTRSKLLSFTEPGLRVDTGDTQLDHELAGYWRIVVGYREFAISKVQDDA